MAGKENYPLRSTETMSMISTNDLKLCTQLMVKIAEMLMKFDANHMRSTFDPLPILKEISVTLERATESFIRNDPDPLDDRHPHRTHPDSALGNILKIIFKNDDFMTKLVVSYILARDNVELSIQGCRLLLACVPGLDSKVVFSEPDDFVPRLYQWAGPGAQNETLQGYAMGLLAAALENTENASKYRNENANMVPFALNRLRQLQARAQDEHKNLGQTDFSSLNAEQNARDVPSTSSGPVPTIEVTPAVEEHVAAATNPPPPKKRRTEPNLAAFYRVDTTNRVPSFHNLKNLDDSNSKWDILQPFLIGKQQVYPLSLATYQRFILQYLAACGEYQDLLLQVFEGNALDLLFDYIDLEKTKDVRLTFDALKYLTSLLVHRKFALEFMEKDGIRALLRLPKTSLASVGVVTCFYYIAYSNDVMELLCQMDDAVVDECIQYVLWCLEHSHESGMASACMFFSQGLLYKAILRRFDQFDGPRKLYNYISTLTIMQCNEEVELTEEQVHTSTQAVRGTCTTFKTYLLAHIYIKMENYKRQFSHILPTGMRIPELFNSQERLDFRSMKIYDETAAECEAIYTEMLRLNGGQFREAENLKRLGLVKMLLAVRVLSRDWMNVSSGLRNDMCVNAMDSLRMMLCQPSIQTELITQHSYNHYKYDGFTVLIQTTLGRTDEESPLRMSALGCIQRCVNVEPECWKTIIQKMKSSEERHSASKRPSKYEEIMNHLELMWTEVRKSDGIMALIALMNTKTPLTEADSIRRLACNTLTGLAKHPEVRQILTRLPLFAQSGLQILMREPVSSDKRDIHAAFCKEAIQLLQVVSGRKMHDQQAKDFQSALIQDKSHRQWVVENTQVSFNQVELLQLIHDHLLKNKLDSVAALLKTEANLPDRPASRANSTALEMKPFPTTGDNFSKLNSVPSLAPRTLESEIGGISARRPTISSTLASPARSHSTEDDNVFATPTLPRRFTTSSATFPKKLMISPARPKMRPVTPGSDNSRPYADLNNIVTSYFRTQHALCENPVTTCPPFSLYYPHKCPDRNQKSSVVQNISLRIMDHELLRPGQRIVSQWSNERSIFSKFRNIKTLHEEESYTKAAFSADDEHVIVGLFSGEVHWINSDTGADDGHTNCHGSALTNIQPSKDGNLLLTSCAYSRPLSALWRLGEALQRVHTYREESCVRFGNTTMQRIIGTSKEKATVYDTETNHVLDSYLSGLNALQYDKNYASFSPDDRMIFNDGLLWDVRNKNSPVHGFDRLSNRTLFGTFHPHGTQIIINSEIYDIRTFRMLYHVPELTRCNITFNSTGNIMFAAEANEFHRPDYPDVPHSPLRSFDTRDYTALTTVEGRRPVLSICSSHHDQTLCIVEQVKPTMSDYMIQTSTQLRFVEIGRFKDNEDENEEEEEETREDHNSDSSGMEMEDIDDDGNASEQGSVFDALGRLGDDSDDDELEDGDDDNDSMDSFDFENALNRIIRRQALLRRQRANSSENVDNADLDDEDASGEESDEEEEEEGDEEADPDFDMGAAIDDLVNAVDEEVDEDELGSDDDSGSWRTASRVGSEDINLDELDEEQAREAENEGEEDDEAAPDADEEAAADAEEEERMNMAEFRAEAAAAARRAILGRGLRNMRLGMGGHRRHPHLPPQADILNARAEEQRLQFMEAIAREGEPADEQNGENGNNDSDHDYQSEEEEINSVSTTALNPALRRRNRRQQNGNESD